MASLVELPLIRPYVLNFGNVGIVLYVRHLYFLLSLASAVISVWSLKRFLKGWWLILAGALPVIFMPFSIPSLSYNTMGMLLLTLGMMILLAGFTYPETRRPWFFLIAGFCLGLSSIAYPPLGLTPLIESAMLVLIIPAGSRARTLALFICGIVASYIFVLYQIFPISSSDLKHFVEFNMNVASSAVVGGGERRLFKLMEHMLKFVWYHISTVTFIVGLAILTQFSRRRGVYILSLLPAIIWLDWKSTYAGQKSIILIGFIAVLGFFAWFLCNKTRDIKLMFQLVWLPSMLSGFITSFASSNGMANAGIGMLPAALLSFALLLGIVADMPTTRDWLPTFATALLGLGVISILTMWNFNYVYRDSHISQLTHRVAGGPYAGIWTTSKRGEDLKLLEQDLKTVLTPNARVFAYYDFPAAYLIGESPSAMNTAWVFRNRSHEFYTRLLSQYSDKGVSLPDAVLRTNALGQSSPVLDDFFTANGFVPVMIRSNYTILKKSNPILKKGPVYAPLPASVSSQNVVASD